MVASLTVHGIRPQDQRFATTGIRVAFMQKEFRAVLQVAALHPVYPCAPASASATLCMPRTLAPSATLCTCLCLHLSAPAAAPPLHPPHLSNPMLPLCTPSAPSPHATSAGQGHRQPHHHTDRTRRRADHLRHGAQRRERRPCSTLMECTMPCTVPCTVPSVMPRRRYQRALPDGVRAGHGRRG